MNHTETMNDRQRELFTVACDALATAVRIIRPPHTALNLDKDVPGLTLVSFGGGYAEIEAELPSGDTLELTLKVYAGALKLESK